MQKKEFENSLKFAEEMDQKDPLRSFRDEFYIPKGNQNGECIYFSGNSLGLQPKKLGEFIQHELDDWADLGVEGHFKAKKAWYSYHENLTESTARLVGAKPVEVVVMNTLTTNLHLLMVSFYRPTQKKFKILVEHTPFPSDRFVVRSQAKFHGYDPDEAIIEMKPREGERTLRDEDILETIEKHGDSIALILFGGVNYLTGQAFDFKEITRLGHSKGCKVGFDLAHATGNLLLHLHDWDVDFAAWCSYKYLNGGPGTLSGVFIHERYSKDNSLSRFEGWWGHDKKTRFLMGPEFSAGEGAEAWQLSNPPIFQMAALRASMEIFDRATMPKLREKSELLTGYLEFLLCQLPAGSCEIVTPSDPKRRGAQLSLIVSGESESILKGLSQAGIVCDFRRPNIVRVAPAPLYNCFMDVFHFAEALGAIR